jgi:hypothetical protein
MNHGTHGTHGKKTKPKRPHYLPLHRVPAAYWSLLTFLSLSFFRVFRVFRG